MSEIKLKPCPFCGSDRNYTLERNHFGEKFVSISCTECHISQTGSEFKTKEEAIQHWNTRKPMDKVIPIATINISKEDMQEIIDEKMKEIELGIELDIQEIRNKAIDEFVEKIIYICENNAIGYDRNKNRPLYANADGIWCDLIKDVVEQMKGD